MLWWVQAAEAAGCETVTYADIAAVQGPAVVVLGERHGMQPDLARATRIVRGFARRGPVTVALEAIHRDLQPTLDDYAAGQFDTDDLEARLNWKKAWGFPYAPYAALVSGALSGAKVIAAGIALGPAPEGVTTPVPSGYLPILRDAMSGHDVPPEREPAFLASMAWRDYAIGEAALNGWDGQGVLVVVTGRGHVEGGKGVAWQIDQRTDVPVSSFVLAWGSNPACYAGDKVWRGLFG